ncbi:MAG: Rieske 2Fe-2S domain-containing protein [Proteobacteria bacterium]|nr:Rieske 2Fe-2S domain-containing protein [Pseudomonadota bacterium]
MTAKGEWFCAMRSEDLRDKPVQVKILGENFVAFRNSMAEPAIFIDVCPHRGAALSKGCVRQGRLECFYHGWQFESSGRCSRIFTLAEGDKIPPVSSARAVLSREIDGYLWLSLGEDRMPGSSTILSLEHLEKDDKFRMLHAQVDIAANYSLVLENFLCPSHVFFTHENMAPFMHRDNCGPFDTDIEEHDFGFIARVRHNKLPITTIYEFRYPSLLEITQRSQWGSTTQHFYVSPIDENHTRLFARGSYPAVTANFEEAQKQFLAILDQDVYLLPSQQENENRGHKIWNAPGLADKLPLFGRRYLEARPFIFGARRIAMGRNRTSTSIDKKESFLPI